MGEARVQTCGRLAGFPIAVGFEDEVDVKKTLLKLALAAAGVAAVSVAQAQPAPAPTPAPGPAPTTTADPNAPVGTPPAPPAGTAAPVAPPATPPAGTAAPVAPPPAAPQVDPNAPPPPPPVAPPPVAPPPGPVAAPTPAPAPFVPPPAPAVNWNANPQGADTVTATEKPKPLRWRGTNFTWLQSANTQYFGLGANYNGQEDMVYDHLFLLAPNFYVVDDPKDKLTVGATVWGSVEATNSNQTTLKNEFQWRDTGLSTKYTRTVLQSMGADGETPEYATKVALGTGVLLPTSKLSMTSRYLGWTASLTGSQLVKLQGSKSDLFPNVNLSLAFSYTHNFNRTNVPATGNLTVPRQSLSGDPLASDVFSGKMLTTDGLRVNPRIGLPVYKDLSLNFSYLQIMGWKPHPPDACVDISTGCAPITTSTANANPVTFFSDTWFDVNIAYSFFGVLDASIGYANYTPGVGENGKRFYGQHNVFYSPDAQFYLDLTASLDSIYSKASGREKKAVAKGTSSSSWF
jgi:hypothetical protein